jgi:hypothetical protein
VATDVAGDFAATGGMTNVKHVVGVKDVDKFVEVVRVGVYVVAVPGLVGAIVTPGSCAIERYPRLARKSIWSSQASELRGQP